MITLTALQNEIITKKSETLHATAKAENKGTRWINNRLNKEKAYHEAIAEGNEIKEIRISVEWKKSATWGMNPTASVEIYTTDKEGNSKYSQFTGTASGCGYDKLSASIATAINGSPDFMKLLYATYEKKGKINKPYGVSFSEYGAYLSGGVGVSSYRSVFEWLGYSFNSIASGKTFDVFTVTK